MASILVVCTGNVCRSPIAEGALRDALTERFGGRAPAVSSAGTAGWGARAVRESVEAAAERGHDIADHVPRVLTAALVGDADLVLCMAGEHREAIGSFGSEGAEERAFTLKELVRLLEQLPPVEAGADPDTLASRVAQAAAARSAGAPTNPWDEDIVDPLGLSMQAYRAIAWEIDEWTERLVARLYGPA